MPRLPGGIFRRAGRRGYYVRVYRDGRERLMKAGDTVEEARATRDRVRGSSVPVTQRTVRQAAALWLERAVPQRRNEAGVRLARQRIEADLVPVAVLERGVVVMWLADCVFLGKR